MLYGELSASFVVQSRGGDGGYSIHLHLHLQFFFTSRCMRVCDRSELFYTSCFSARWKVVFIFLASPRCRCSVHQSSLTTCPMEEWVSEAALACQTRQIEMKRRKNEMNWAQNIKLKIIINQIWLSTTSTHMHMHTCEVNANRPKPIANCMYACMHAYIHSDQGSKGADYPSFESDLKITPLNFLKNGDHLSTILQYC